MVIRKLLHRADGKKLHSKKKPKTAGCGVRDSDISLLLRDVYASNVRAFNTAQRSEIPANARISNIYPTLINIFGFSLQLRIVYSTRHR